MSSLRRLLLRLYHVFRRGPAEEQLAREMAAHLALIEEDYRRRGLNAEEARAAARRAFGGVDQAKEIQRDARSFRWLDDARRDVGYAARTLSRTPGFTALAVLTLGLGIGAVSVIYSVVRNVLLEPFPYPNSRRMVDVLVKDANGGLVRGALPPAEFLDFKEQSTVFEDAVGALGQEMHYSSEAGNEVVSVVLLTPNSFTFLGVEPLLGRYFGAADSAPAAPPVAVLSHRTWVRLFGADPTVVGHTVVLNRQPRAIIGVMPPRFEWHVADFWLPGPISRAMPDSASAPAGRWFQARLKPGVTVQEAEAQLNVIAARRTGQFPGDYPENSHVQVITVIDWVVGQFRRALYTLFAAVVLLLLIACCNVASMLLARATSREREISVRAALGASRGRIVRQFLVESMLLAAGGLAVACVLASAGVDALARFLPRRGVPWETELRIDRTVLLFAFATAAAATLFFGVFPALQAARRELVAGANTGGRAGTASRRQTRMRAGLVVVEVAFCVVLLLAAGLLVRNFLALVGAHIGFDERNVLLAGVSFPPEFRNGAGRNLFFSRCLERLQSTPGVMFAAVARGQPPEIPFTSKIEITGDALDASASSVVQLCSEQYFQVLQLGARAGRTFSPAEVAGRRKVAVVNDAFVRRYLAGGNPLGRSIRLAALATLPRDPVADPTFEIVGVVHDVANQGLGQPARPHVYVPFTVTAPPLMFLLRTAGSPAASTGAVRSAIGEVDPQVAFAGAITMEERMHRYYAQPRFSVIVLAMFAGTGLLLVAIGIYGVMAYSVSQQTREIAIRMALGGSRSTVLRMVFGSGMALLAAGTIAGLAASIAVGRLLAAQLTNVSPHDPVTVAAVVAVVAAIGVLSCWVPARRAMAVEPVAALRQE